MSSYAAQKPRIHLSFLGNIGAGKNQIKKLINKCTNLGKSSVIKIMQNYRNMVIADEPIEKWESGPNLLKMQYINPKKWSFLFQTQVLITLR